MLSRLSQLVVGLFLCGLGSAAMVRSGLGLGPWDVLHQGVALRTGASFGLVVIGLGFAVLLLWLPLRQRPGIGTMINMVLVGASADFVLSILSDAEGLLLQLLTVAGGIVAIGVGTGVYIGAGLGAGPRDGLMTGLVARYGWPVRPVRIAMELVVLALGWLGGGSVGVGTIAFALLLGPVLHWTIPLFDRDGRVQNKADHEPG